MAILSPQHQNLIYRAQRASELAVDCNLPILIRAASLRLWCKLYPEGIPLISHLVAMKANAKLTAHKNCKTPPRILNELTAELEEIAVSNYTTDQTIQ